LFPKEFKDAVFLLLLSSKRAGRQQGALPSEIWEQVFSFCSPLWFFKDGKAKAIAFEGGGDAEDTGALQQGRRGQSTCSMS
jgi:hypothetical protein